MSQDVSRLLDGDVSGDELERTLASVASNENLRDDLTRYTLIGDVLRSNSTPDDGFTIRILERMRETGAKIEPGYDPLAKTD